MPFNLLRSTLSDQPIWFKKKQILIAIGITLVVLLWWHLILNRQLNTVTQQLEKLQQQLEYAKKAATKQQLTNKITNLELQQLWLVQIFTKLHLIKPGNSQLTQLVVKNDEVKLCGQADSMFGITQILKSLTSMQRCTAPTIQKITRQGDVYNFIVLLSCRNPKSGIL